MIDPMEARIARALDHAGIRYTEGDANESRLDFRLTDYGVEIEVKRFHSARIGEQMSRSPDVIVAQGSKAVAFLALAIEALKGCSSVGRAPVSKTGSASSSLATLATPSTEAEEA